ncbi:hypothetical protein [Sorangium cellulosum]|uniref:hypothetical protein n=1 Tax=Sorangium cellulosum TaxID=56 RepID=UPI0012DAFC87|nr:hypothetical protein [Sorangium cellulosum]
MEIWMSKKDDSKENKSAETCTTEPRSVCMRANAGPAPSVERAGAPREPVGSADEGVYTAEEVGTTYGITADEVMTIAEGLGIIGDPRYGRWIPSDSPRSKSEERIPLSTHVGPVVRANIEHMLRQIDDRIKELMVKSVETGPGFTILVCDPTEPLAEQIPFDDKLEFMAYAERKPLAALLPTETVLRYLEHFERTPDLLTMLDRLQAPRDGARVPIVLVYGRLLGFHEAVLVPNDFELIPGVDVQQLPGFDAYEISLAGVIKVLCGADLRDANAGWPTERVRLARARAIAAIEAERVKPNPRSVDEVLVGTFGGDRLRRAFETEGVEGVVRVIDSVLRAAN